MSDEWKTFLKKEFNISNNFAEASDHPRTCKCSICFSWWRTVWDDDCADECPFTRKELFGD